MIKDSETTPPKFTERLGDLVVCVAMVVLGPLLTPMMAWDDAQVWYAKRGRIERRREERRVGEDRRKS